MSDVVQVIVTDEELGLLTVMVTQETGDNIVIGLSEETISINVAEMGLTGKDGLKGEKGDPGVRITIGPIEPSNPIENDLWIDTS